MQSTLQKLSASTALLVIATSEVLGSGAGAALYMPRREPTHPVQQASFQHACPPGTGCESCASLGVAGVEHATPAPCTAEGGCYPARNTFGFHPTRWRRWPGADYGGGGPEVANPADDLGIIDPPAAEVEDRRAPPPIEESTQDAADPTEPTMEAEPPAAFGGPGREINLPPMPAPADRPLGPPPQREEGGPPTLPFGRGPGAQPSGPPSLPFGSTLPVPPSRRGDGPPRSPFSPQHLPPTPTGGDAPPPLPFGFSQTPTGELIRRLPIAAPAVRYDSAVRPVAAHMPVR